ncbi:MAG TPA: ATP-binding protein [Solirubrobacteraceae bacterium]|nr:ATP-binding protein [Solirubrobacteraceae bacterium]
MLVLAVVSLGVPLALSLRERVDAEVHSQALSQADVVAATSADLLSPPNATELEALVRSSGASVRGRVLIVNVRGQVLADSAGPSALGISYLSRPEIVSALHGKAVQTQRASHSLGENILATAVPVLRRGSAIGAVRITQSVAAVQKAVRSTVAKLGLVAVTVLLLGLLAGGLIARQVALPLRRLESAARRLAGGELSARAIVEGSSEQRSLSASFNEMADRVQRLIGAQREFVADASHQLRTPLTGLRLRLEEARATGVGEAAAAELDAGTAEVDRLAAIVDELLVLSRAEDRELQGERVDLPDAARRAAERWHAAAEARGIALELLGGGAGSAWCARADLDRALDALIENALRYSPAGGEVALAGGDGRIEVRDRGPGLAPGEDELVFERFHRGRAGRQGPAGSGLGLAIARTLARAWHGEARLRNRSGGGVVAVLEFPEPDR